MTSNSSSKQTSEGNTSHSKRGSISGAFRRFSRFSSSSNPDPVSITTTSTHGSTSTRTKSGDFTTHTTGSEPAAYPSKTNGNRSDLNQSVGTSTDKKDLWLDCDIGHDDAIALLLALSLPNLNLLGVSTVSGNAPGAATFANAARCLSAFRAGEHVSEDGTEILKTPIPLFRGADEPLVKTPRSDPAIHGEDGLGGVVGLPSLANSSVQRHLNYSAPASSSSSSKNEIPASTLPQFLQYFSNLLKERISNGQPKIDLAVTGPMTNIAIFYKVFPDLFVDGIEQVVVMGGAAGVRGNRGPLAEFNVIVDPEAASIIFNSPVKVVMVGLNVTHQAIFTPSLHDRLLRGKASGQSNTSPNNENNPSSSSPPSSPSPSQSQPSSPNFNTKPLPSSTSTSTPPSNLRKLISSVLLFFASTYFNEFNFTRGPPVHDMLVIAYIADPTIFYKVVNGGNNSTSASASASGSNNKPSQKEADPQLQASASSRRLQLLPPKRYRVDVECNDGSLALGATVVDFYGDKKIQNDGWARGGRNVEVLETVDTKRLWNLFFQTVDLAEDHLASLETISHASGS